MPHAPTTQTTLLVLAFVAVYLVILFRNTVRDHIDLYDFMLLSLVAVVPGAFVLFPALSFELAHLAGVEFPFVLLFGGLSVIVFIALYKLVRQVTRLRRSLVALTQEIGLIENRLSVQGGRAEAPPADDA
jgi:hypothetical protein